MTSIASAGVPGSSEFSAPHSTAQVSRTVAVSPTLSLIVVEDRIIGSITRDADYLAFDADGTLLGVATTPDEARALVERSRTAPLSYSVTVHPSRRNRKAGGFSKLLAAFSHTSGDRTRRH